MERPIPVEMEPLMQEVQQWVHTIVVGLNFCPFARPVVEQKTLRTVPCTSDEFRAQLQFFLEELELIASEPPTQIATTLLLFPQGLEDFQDFLEFLYTCEDLLEESGLEGVFQIASFHPEYVFDGVDAEDVSHWTNRAPCPILHLIREDDISRVVDGRADTESIPERNIEVLQAMSREELRQHFPWLMK